MSAKRAREPGADEPREEGMVEPQKPSIEVEREQAGVEEDDDETPAPAAPDETLLPPD